MGEAIITRGCYGGGDSGASDMAISGFYTYDTIYTYSKSGNYRVTCIGGGGAGSNSRMQASGSSGYYIQNAGGGGGSGYINTKDVYLNKNESVSIIIGIGGSVNESSVGGTTSFGTYVAAVGGMNGAWNSNAGTGGNWGIWYSGGTNSYQVSDTAGRNGGILYYENDNMYNISKTNNGSHTYLAYGYGGKSGGFISNVFTSQPGKNGGNGWISICYLD